MMQHYLVFLLLFTLPAALSAKLLKRYDDDLTLRQLRLEDLEREQETGEMDLNRPPLLPTHYDWWPNGAQSVPASFMRNAAQLERLRQLQQLSAGYALPPQPRHLSGGGYVLLSPLDGPNHNARPTPLTPPTGGSSSLLQPIVPYEHVEGVQYLSSNTLEQPATVPTLLPTLHAPNQLRLAYAGVPLRRPSPSQASILQQSKQFAFAPPAQRNYASGSARIPLPYPPSFISITTRRPYTLNGYAKPFRPSQPDPTPDLFAGRNSKSLLDSYIPSWEVLRLLQQHQAQQQQHQQRHTLAYPLRLYKRDSAQSQRSGGSVKRSLDVVSQ